MNFKIIIRHILVLFLFLKGLFTLLSVIPLFLQYLAKDFANASNFSEVMETVNSMSIRMAIILAIIAGLELFIKGIYEFGEMSKDR